MVKYLIFTGVLYELVVVKYLIFIRVLLKELVVVKYLIFTWMLLL